MDADERVIRQTTRRGQISTGMSAWQSECRDLDALLGRSRHRRFRGYESDKTPETTLDERTDLISAVDIRTAGWL